MFALGIPIPIHTLKGLKRLGAAALPLVGRFPLSMIYPTGEKQDEIVPRYEKWYAWAEIIAGDCHYIKRHMPDDLDGKVIVTNTTTENDMEAFRARGVTHVMTTTPRIEGRSFGTNMLEAALTSVASKQRPLKRKELSTLLNQLKIEPTVHSL
jgi:hypothetical protein